MEELRFACDAMLGTLARWLRLAGFDTRFDPGRGDDELASVASSEGRWLLTRDRALASTAGPRVVLVRESALEAQIEELRRRLPLDARRPDWLCRCPHCNGLLRPASREEVTPLVPPFVAAHAAAFRLCTLCRRAYWPGTHVPRIAARLAALFGSGEKLGRAEHEGDG